MKTIIGNWKMEVGTRESVALARGSLLALRGKRVLPDVVICPPFVSLGEVRKVVARSRVALGAQNMMWEEKGAFTGEISPRMLEEHGVSHVIVGHSERRSWFGETDDMVNKKTVTALGHGLFPIVCVGETKEQRAGGDAGAIVAHQLRAALEGVMLRSRDKLFVAYEPVWAIGSGESSSAAEAVEMHARIRSVLQERFPNALPDQVSVLYGGSVTDENAYSFLRETEIDGLLVGGASVRMNQFAKILESATDVLEGMQE